MTILLQDLMPMECLQVWGGDALRTLHVFIMFSSCPQKLWDFHRGSSVGQDNLTKAN